MKFEILQQDSRSKARAGILKTDHGSIHTPIFIPVGTIASVKTIHQRTLKDDIKAQIILGNTYHLFLRPGISIFEKAKGIHKFMNWSLPILTDSGGFQIYSLNGSKKIIEEGVSIKSYIDGSYHFFSPEFIMDAQRSIGADIIMAFDECTPIPSEYSYVKDSMERTHRWLIRCRDYLRTHPEKYDYYQSFFPIVQGGIYPDLRKKSAQIIANLETDGNAIGGLSVGESADQMYEMIDLVTDILPIKKPRYLMGVGMPVNILESISLGVDMFDCVIPTRNARNGMLFTWQGILNIRNKKWEEDFSPLDIQGTSFVDAYYSRAYVRHLFISGEYLGKQIASAHNLAFYLNLVFTARKHILLGNFLEWKHSVFSNLLRRL